MYELKFENKSLILSQEGKPIFIQPYKPPGLNENRRDWADAEEAFQYWDDELSHTFAFIAEENLTIVNRD